MTSYTFVFAFTEVLSQIFGGRMTIEFRLSMPRFSHRSDLESMYDIKLESMYDVKLESVNDIKLFVF